MLSEKVTLYRKEVELFQRGFPEQIALQREKLSLEREIQAAKERWKQLEAIGKIAKYVVENMD
ncbi:MAG: hypothetical protein Q8898_17225 [Bacillota bacterium]|nr:hypothetical protein [Bacillota bacterium]